MEIYFDNSATTPVFPCVREVMMRTMEDDFGNPSSMHRKGMDAETLYSYREDADCEDTESG